MTDKAAHCTALDQCYWNKENWFAVHWRKDSAHIGQYNASHYWIFYQNKKPILKVLRTDKNNNFKFTIKFLMTLERSYIGYLGFLGIDLFRSVLMYSNGASCLIKLLFKMGLFTVWGDHRSWKFWCCSITMDFIYDGVYILNKCS